MLQKTAKQKGFSLIEIMVVLVIIGLLTSIVGPRVIDVLSKGYEKKARADFKNIETTLKVYRIDNYTYPTTEQGLEALVTAPNVAPEPRNYPPGGYMDSLPKDPWGRDYVYISPGDVKAYDIYTLGADGLNGGEGDNADLSIWDEQ